jgi:hypothetical protein
VFDKPPQEMTLQEIESRLAEIDIEFQSHEGDDEYDLSELQDEKNELKNAIANGEYADFKEWE